MRKLFLLMLTLAMLLFCASAAAQTLTFDAIYASCEIPDEYILLLPDNLALHPEWVTAHAGSEAQLLADWSERGVLAQAWSTTGDMCIEITAVQDADAQQIFDVDQQSTAIRGAYRTGIAKGEAWKALGYTVQSAEWKNNNRIGRFLVMKYKRTVDGATYRGIARRTVRNGYSIMVDVQVFDRNVKTADQRVLDTLMDSWTFSQTLSKPVDVVSEVTFTKVPPLESNTGKFTIEGTCDPGLHLVGVAMRMSSPDPVRFETTANKKGKFVMDVKLPQEGVWLVSITAMNGGAEVGDYVFETTTYQKSLLTVNFDKPLPEGEGSIVGDKLVISGVTDKQTTVQCIVSGMTSFQKQVKTNNSGKFSFSVDVSAEGDYDIVLVFTKKNFSTRRYAVTANHTITDADLQLRAKENAIKPAYSTLTSKLTGYTGKIMKYKVYVMRVEQAGDEWVIYCAMDRKGDAYRSVIVVTTDKEPDVTPDSEHTMYGTCTGAYVIDNEESSVTYPGFKLIFFED